MVRRPLGRYGGQADSGILRGARHQSRLPRGRGHLPGGGRVGPEAAVYPAKATSAPRWTSSTSSTCRAAGAPARAAVPDGVVRAGKCSRTLDAGADAPEADRGGQPGRGRGKGDAGGPPELARQCEPPATLADLKGNDRRHADVVGFGVRLSDRRPEPDGIRCRCAR